MGNNDYRQSQLLVQPFENVKNIIGGLSVHGPRGLIRQKKLGGIGKCNGNGNTLLFTAGHLLHFIILLMGQPHHVEQHIRSLPALLIAVELHGHHDVLIGAEIGQKVASVILPYEAYRIPLVGHQLLLRHGEEILTVHEKLPRTGPVQSAQHIQEGGFPAAAAADNRHHLPLLHIQIQTLQGDHFNILRFVNFHQVICPDNHITHSNLPSSSSYTTSPAPISEVSCVVITMVTFSFSTISLNRLITFTAVAESSSAVGSSAKMIPGL